MLLHSAPEIALTRVGSVACAGDAGDEDDAGCSNEIRHGHAVNIHQNKKEERQGGERRGLGSGVYALVGMVRVVGMVRMVRMVVMVKPSLEVQLPRVRRGDLRIFFKCKALARIIVERAGGRELVLALCEGRAHHVGFGWVFSIGWKCSPSRRVLMWHVTVRTRQRQKRQQQQHDAQHHRCCKAPRCWETAT